MMLLDWLFLTSEIKNEFVKTCKASVDSLLSIKGSYSRQILNEVIDSSLVPFQVSFLEAAVIPQHCQSGLCKDIKSYSKFYR